MEDSIQENGSVTKIFTEILGRTLVSVEQNPERDVLVFRFEDGDVYNMYHAQDCCEEVTIEDVTGDFSDLIGSPLTEAEEVAKPNAEKWETWTFYKFRTEKGSVTIG